MLVVESQTLWFTIFSLKNLILVKQMFWTSFTMQMWPLLTLVYKWVKLCAWYHMRNETIFRFNRVLYFTTWVCVKVLVCGKTFFFIMIWTRKQLLPLSFPVPTIALYLIIWQMTVHLSSLSLPMLSLITSELALSWNSTIYSKTLKFNQR